MNEEEKLVPTGLDADHAVIEDPRKNSFVKRKKKKDYHNRSKWKLRKEMKQKEKMLEQEEVLEPVEKVFEEKEEVLEPIEEVVEPREDVVKEYLEPSKKEVVEDIIKEYIEPEDNTVVEEPVLEPLEVSPEIAPTTEVIVQPTPSTEAPKVIKSKTTTYDIDKLYVNFETRVSALVGGILLLFGIASYLIISTLQQYEEHQVKYLENTSVHYEACEASGTCLNGVSMYEADKLSVIHIQYHFFAQFEKQVDYDLTYRVVAVHKIFDRYDSRKVSYEQEDILVSDEKVESTGNYVQIDAKADVDFQKYHSFVLDYKKKYSDISHSSLNVQFCLDDGTSTQIVGDVAIPLASEKFGIITDNVENVTKVYHYSTNSWTKSSLINIIIGCVLVLLSLFLLIHLTKLVLALAGKKSKYQDFLSMILKDYDRLIINAKDGFEIDSNKKLVKVLTFDELLSIRSNLNKPIIYSKVNNVKSEFIVEDDEIVYRFVLKEADMGE